MKLTELRIAPTRSYDGFGPDNPLKAVVKLATDSSTIECVLSAETMRKMVDLCATEIAENARKNVDEFVSAVTAIEGNKSAALIEKN